MNKQSLTLADLGWRPLLQQQISFDELETGYAARVDSVYRDRLHLCSEQGNFTIEISGILDAVEAEQRATTGDWLWLENDTHKPLKLLERQNLLTRTAAGSVSKTQLIAANIDTIFIVSSCNQDFNLSRIERYLSLVLAAHIPAVIVLTKADLCEQPETYVEQAQKIHRDVPVLTLNALSAQVIDEFSGWIKAGQTIAFLGSSGVGKSTLTNSLLGKTIQETGGIREDDAKGRHTTTNRSMHKIPKLGWVLDTPGMREIRLNDDNEGVADVFADIEALTQQCRFNNCHHQGDVGCAIEQAIADGQLEQRRWNNYLKLMQEAEFAGQSRAERKKSREQWGKEISKFARQHKKLHGK